MLEFIFQKPLVNHLQRNQVTDFLWQKLVKNPEREKNIE